MKELCSVCNQKMIFLFSTPLFEYYGCRNCQKVIEIENTIDEQKRNRRIIDGVSLGTFAIRNKNRLEASIIKMILGNNTILIPKVYCPDCGTEMILLIPYESAIGECVIDQNTQHFGCPNCKAIFEDEKGDCVIDRAALMPLSEDVLYTLDTYPSGQGNNPLSSYYDGFKVIIESTMIGYKRKEVKVMPAKPLMAGDIEDCPEEEYGDCPECNSTMTIVYRKDGIIPENIVYWYCWICNKVFEREYDGTTGAPRDLKECIISVSDFLDTIDITRE